jgi:hypothetical protein
MYFKSAIYSTTDFGLMTGASDKRRAIVAESVISVLGGQTRALTLGSRSHFASIKQFRDTSDGPRSDI